MIYNIIDDNIMPTPVPATTTVYIGPKAKAMNTAFDIGSTKVLNVLDPTDAQDAATKKYVDDTVKTEEERAKDKEDDLDTAITTEKDRAEKQEDILMGKAFSGVNLLPTFGVMGGDPSDPDNQLLHLLPPPSECYLDGWLVHKNVTSNKKVNFYFAPPKPQFKVEDLNALSMLIFPRSNESLPFFNLYTPPVTPPTKKTDPWYSKRVTWSVSNNNDIIIKPQAEAYQQLSYQLYTYVNQIDLNGNILTQVPPTDIQTNSLPNYGFSQIRLTLDSCTNYDGTKTTLSPTDIIQFIAVGTNSGAEENQVNFVLNLFSYCASSGNYQSNMDSSSLFTSTSNKALQAKIDDLNSSLLSLAQTLYGSTVVPSIPFEFEGEHSAPATGGGSG
jgi:hypothetical protein